ncbi:MAG TPA: WXG100 family type VII secretion target [Nocardioides sp.]|uniref:WXG100 family type VII secretion target n=1 Tax=Nocardioides sp. TaxID=35761 RepID=UPI002E2F334A|nr:WXG100 family type VII secretion target [Nocardioides sp.]HEX5089814.1 WXG100 family type VII secretion target [Nocardioides sp.]
MARAYAVDLAELQDRIDEMAAFEKTIEKALHHLDDVVENLHVTWTGEAAAAHRAAHADWVAGMEEMRRGLAEMRAAADRAHANYSSAAGANSRMWRSVR